MSSQTTQADEARFTIFRGADAKPLVIEQTTGVSDIVLEGIKKLDAVGGLESGSETRVVFEVPGFSLVYLWFKSGYHLPRHSHGMDCAYYVVGGSLQMGNDVLGKGDGFFVPADVPYTYVAGPKGVEILEFRHCHCGDIRIMADNPAFWEKLAATAPANRVRWESEKRPAPMFAEAALRSDPV
jgi:hypothetical protein